MSFKCIVKGCENTSDLGVFIGDICLPCHHYLTIGKIGPTASFLGDLQETSDCVKELIEKYNKKQVFHCKTSNGK